MRLTNKNRNIEERIDMLSNVTTDVVWDWDLVNGSMWWNENYFNYFGYKKNLLSNNPASWQSGIHPEDRERVLGEIKHFFDTKHNFWTAEYRFLKANFTILNIYSRGNIFYDSSGSPVRMTGSMLDVSEQKKAELDLKRVNGELLDLSEHLQQQREKDKSSVAYEMHEQLGQELAGIHLMISSVVEKIAPVDDTLAIQLINLNRLLEGSIDKVREISSGLYPGILKDMGLTDTLDWYGKKFSLESGIKYFFLSETEEIFMPHEKSIVIFRVFQQALKNCIEHRATEVICSLSVESNDLKISISDNGKNFMKSEENKISIEYRAMQLSVFSIKGKLTVEIDWNSGTEMLIILPSALEQ